MARTKGKKVKQIRSKKQEDHKGSQMADADGDVGMRRQIPTDVNTAANAAEESHPTHRSTSSVVDKASINTNDNVDNILSRTAKPLHRILFPNIVNNTTNRSLESVSTPIDTKKSALKTGKSAVDTTTPAGMSRTAKKKSVYTDPIFQLIDFSAYSDEEGNDEENRNERDEATQHPGQVREAVSSSDPVRQDKPGTFVDWSTKPLGNQHYSASDAGSEIIQHNTPGKYGRDGRVIDWHYRPPPQSSFNTTSGQSNYPISYGSQNLQSFIKPPSPPYQYDPDLPPREQPDFTYAIDPVPPRPLASAASLDLAAQAQAGNFRENMTNQARIIQAGVPLATNDTRSLGMYSTLTDLFNTGTETNSMLDDPDFHAFAASARFLPGREGLKPQVVRDREKKERIDMGKRRTREDEEDEGENRKKGLDTIVGKDEALEIMRYAAKPRNTGS